MNLLHKIGAGSAMFAASAFAAMPAWAQEVAEEAAPVADKGDTAWMMVSTVLVLMMILPGLALFYGGLTRTKNMLSTLTQIGAAPALAMLLRQADRRGGNECVGKCRSRWGPYTKKKK